jgi:hypothetical protein
MQNRGLPRFVAIAKTSRTSGSPGTGQVSVNKLLRRSSNRPALYVAHRIALSVSRNPGCKARQRTRDRNEHFVSRAPLSDLSVLTLVYTKNQFGFLVRETMRM